MALSDMQVYNQYVQPEIIEQVAQMTNAFNAASNGAITLSPEGFDGNFFDMSFYQTLSSARRRVDRLAANGAVAATDLTQLEESKVKVAGGFGPIRFEPSQMTWLRKPTQEGVTVAARNFAELFVQDMLNSAIASAVAAIENQPTATNDVSASAGVGYGMMNDAHALFGDASQSIICNVMNGAAYHKLIGANLTNTERLFVAGNVQVVSDPLGRPIVVTDAPALTVSTTDYKILGLVAGGVMVHDFGDIIANIETNNGNARIETTYQTDYSFALGLKGYTWDKTNGGASPDDTELATGSNWDKVATDIKHTAGVIAVGNQS